MTDEIDVLKLVTSRLEEAAIPYMVTGSMAAGYYATPRMTRDADVVVELNVADAGPLAQSPSASKAYSERSSPDDRH